MTNEARQAAATQRALMGDSRKFHAPFDEGNGLIRALCGAGVIRAGRSAPGALRVKAAPTAGEVTCMSCLRWLRVRATAKSR